MRAAARKGGEVRWFGVPRFRETQRERHRERERDRETERERERDGVFGWKEEEEGFGFLMPSLVILCAHGCSCNSCASKSRAFRKRPDTASDRRWE